MIMPPEEIENMKENMFREMRAIMSVREILDQSDLEAAYDLKTRRIYYYTTIAGLGDNPQSKIDYDLTSESPFDKLEERNVEILRLNDPETTDYIYNNFIIDNDQETLNSLSEMPTGYVFVGYNYVYEYVAKKLGIIPDKPEDG